MKNKVKDYDFHRLKPKIVASIELEAFMEIHLKNQ